jgi:hypothetical protein
VLTTRSKVVTDYCLTVRFRSPLALKRGGLEAFLKPPNAGKLEAFFKSPIAGKLEAFFKSPIAGGTESALKVPERGGTESALKVPLLKGDLGGSKIMEKARFLNGFSLKLTSRN